VICRRGRSPVALAAAVLLLALTGCSVSDQSEPRPIDSDIAELLSQSATPTPAESAPVVRTRVTWVKGADYVRSVRRLPAQNRQQQLELALVALVAGPVSAELDAGLESRIPPSLTVDGIVRGDRVVLDVPNDSQFEQSGVEQAVGQLAITALSLPDVQQVLFTIDGTRTAVPVPDAKKPQRVVTMADYRRALRR
jgi:hypothetical protein